jgi:heme oxygenase (biliverdin-IX-beta and delta-forming)
LLNTPLTQAIPAGLLKQHTAQQHEYAEFLLLPKLKNINTLADYTAILRMFYGFFAPVQEAISQFVLKEQLPDIAARRHARLILSDLENCGSQEVPLICTQLPAIDNTASAFGALYVLEGSTLGGRMIARMLNQNATVPLRTEQLRFFQGYGEQTGPMWVRFIASLNQQTDINTLTASAQDTFICLANWIKHTLYAGRHQEK